jgi:hypothetical protein
MAEKSAIEWTDATWNPTTGCTKVSPACANCYIERTPPFRVRGRKFVNGHIPIEFEIHCESCDERMRFDTVDVARKQPVYYCIHCAYRVRIEGLYNLPAPPSSGATTGGRLTPEPQRQEEQ